MLYQEHHSSSRLFAGLAVVAVIHVAAILAFKNGLVRDFVPLLPKSIEAYIVETVQPSEPPPPPEQVEIEQPVIEPLPFEPVPIELPPVDTLEIAPQAESSTAVEVDTGSGKGPAILEFQVDSRYPLTKPQYPPQSIRLHEEGVVTLLVYVLPNGRVGDVKVSRSSGYPRLDESAMREARRSWRFQPRTVGGRAVAAWGTFKVKFELDR